MRDILIGLFNRDLDRLAEEISQYKNEKDLWLVENAISNSAGNLTLHLIGNLNHYIAATLGNSHFVRNRENEFSDKFIERDLLMSKIKETKDLVESTILQLPYSTFDDDYPIEVFNNKMSTKFFLSHLTTHLNYHLGQINYHRKLLGK